MARNVSWGTEFVDIDLDGDLDWVIANGHAQIWDEGLPPKRHGIRYRLKNSLLRNDGPISFKNIGPLSGNAFQVTKQSRGLVYSDIDRDGDMDLLFTNLHDTPELYLNNTERHGNNWINITLEGTESNRSGIGSRVIVYSQGKKQIREIRSGQSFLGQSELSAHFGLGKSALVDLVVVKWPSGKVTRLPGVDINQHLTILEK